LAQPQVSKHLRVLREVGLVSVRGSGRQRLYRLNAERLKPIHDWVRSLEPFWDQQLDRIMERGERRRGEGSAGVVKADKERWDRQRIGLSWRCRLSTSSRTSRSPLRLRSGSRRCWRSWARPGPCRAASRFRW